MLRKKEIHENKKKCINAINVIIKGLTINRDKIQDNIPLENEDWVPLAVELNGIMDILTNRLYVDNNNNNNNKE